MLSIFDIIGYEYGGHIHWTSIGRVCYDSKTSFSFFTIHTSSYIIVQITMQKGLIVLLSEVCIHAKFQVNWIRKSVLKLKMKCVTPGIAGLVGNEGVSFPKCCIFNRSLQRFKSIWSSGSRLK